MTNATQLTQEQLDAAARDQEVKVQAIIKTLTVQRDSANNAVVNALADKAVVDARLNTETELRVRYQQGFNTLNQSASEMRILIANMQLQIDEGAAQIETLNHTISQHETTIESLSTKAEPETERAQIDEEQVEVPSVMDEVPPLPPTESLKEECPDCSECSASCSNKILLNDIASRPK